jgi:hypothetical protein
MGARYFTNASRPHMDSHNGIRLFTNEPRIHVLWDGKDTNRQNSTMAAGVIWVPLMSLMRQGNSLGYGFQVQGSGVTKIEGSMSPARQALYMKDNDTYWNAIVTAENANFQTISTAPTAGTVVQSLNFYTLARITFSVGTPSSVVITTI